MSAREAGARGALVVFAKAPRPGTVKTRLCPPLTAEQAAELYACMLDDVLELSAAACARLGLAPLLAVHPPDAEAELAARAPAGFRTTPQRGDGLAARMESAVAEAAKAGHAPVILRGSDSPALRGELIEAAVAGLRGADLVVAPGADGGYDLVGLRAPAPGVFDHPMSTGSVLEDTLANARRLGLHCALLAPTFDLDTVADLARLAAARREAEPPPCPRTLAHLDRHGLWELGGNCAEIGHHRH